jgi:TRAP transporter TAXI family solute receptor
MQKPQRHSQLRDLLGIFLPALLVVGGAFFVTLQFVQPAPPNRIVVAAASKGSPYFDLAERYRQALAVHGVTLEIKETSGSLENLKLLLDGRAGVAAGFLQGGTTTARDAPSLRSLGRVLYEPLWLFRNAGVSIERMADLKGKHVLVGPAGGGTNQLATQLLAASGVTRETASLINMELPDYVEALGRGNADAGFLVLAANARTVRQLFADPNVRLVGLPQADAYAQRFPFLTRLDLSEGIVDFAENIPDENMPLVATVASFVVRDDIHPALANLLTQAMVAAHAAPAVERNGEVGIFEGGGVFPMQNDPVFGMADEARQVYRSGPPFLQRYMPFWLATFLNRMIVMAIPIIGVLLPALRFAPMLYTWRMRRRLLRWYRELKNLENESEGTAVVRIREKQARIEEIERAVDHLKLPIGFANQLYDLRLHIDMVRRRLAAKAA